ncbi:MAG: beta-ketoacyl-[acyl-carrier-protein] synthase family protein [bacterium]
MDSTVTAREFAVAGCGVVTALGCGMRSLEQAVAGNASAVRQFDAIAGKGYQSEVAAGIPAAVMAQVDSLCPPAADTVPLRLAFAAAAEAKLGMGDAWSRIPPGRIAVVLSTTKADTLALEAAVDGRPAPAGHCRHILPMGLAGDLAELLGARGPVQCVSLACTSGIMALQQGCTLLRRGQADVVCVVGVDIMTQFVLSGFSSLKSLDPRGCRPFDATRAGLSLGEGAGAVVLVRPDFPAHTGCMVIGCGSSNDANHLTGPSRDGAGLALAINRALGAASLPAGRIEYINAHGTGTVYSDAMESLAFKTVFGEKVPPVSASKGMFGHTLGAAGVIEAVVCFIAGRSGTLPGTPGLGTPDPVAPQSILARPKPGVFPHYILKTNSGFGGMNAALVMEVRNK